METESLLNSSGPADLLDQLKSNPQLASELGQSYVPSWFGKLGPKARDAVYYQYNQAQQTDAGRNLMALTGLLGGGGLLAYTLSKMKDKADTAPEDRQRVMPKMAAAPTIHADNLDSPSLVGSVLGGPLSIVNNAVGAASGGADQWTSALATNPTLAWSLLAGIPAAGMSGLLLKKFIDKNYESSGRNAAELDRVQQEFESLLSKQGSAKLNKARGFIEALEDHYHEKCANNIYEVLLPALAAGAGITAGGLYMSRDDFNQDDIREQAAKEAVKRWRMLKSPSIKAMLVDDITDADEMNTLDTELRNVVPIVRSDFDPKARSQVSSKGDTLEPSPFDKMGFAILDIKNTAREIVAGVRKSEGLEKMAEGELESLSPSDLAQQIQGMYQASPQLIGAVVTKLKATNPSMVKQLGGINAPPDQIINNLIEILNADGFIGGIKARIARNKILDSINDVTQGGGTKALMQQAQQDAATNQGMQIPFGIKPWQLGTALGLGGAGYMLDRPWLGALGAAGALTLPQLIQNFGPLADQQQAQQQAQQSQGTPWMNMDESLQQMPAQQQNPNMEQPTFIDKTLQGIGGFAGGLTGSQQLWEDGPNIPNIVAAPAMAVAPIATGASSAIAASSPVEHIRDWSEKATDWLQGAGEGAWHTIREPFYATAANLNKGFQTGREFGL